MNTIIFFTIFIFVFALINFYIYKRFIKKIGIQNRYKSYLKAVLVFMFILQILYALSFRLDILPSFIYYILSISIGLSFMAFIVALVYDFIHIILSKAKIHDQKKERLKAGLDLFVAFILIAYIGIGFIGGKVFPEVKTTTVTIEDFPFEEFVIIQITDVHVGHTIKKDFVKKMVDLINTQNADMVVITGDLIDKNIEKMTDDIDPLKELKSKYGTFFVYGNHEYFHGYEKIGEYLKNLNITVLDDESLIVGGNKKSFNLIGIKDKIGERLGLGVSNIDKAFGDINSSLNNIVLVHQPSMIKKLEQYNPNLVISGHTHGGQIFPFSYLVGLEQPYLAGLYRHNKNTQIYVSRGTGFWGPPIRVLAPSEISKIIIKPKE